VCHESALVRQFTDARNVLCYRKDGGRPPGVVLQEMISNHHKLLWSKATVVVRQESSFTRQLLMHKMCYATEKMGVGPPDSHYRM
jgi:hypothetical protein